MIDGAVSWFWNHNTSAQARLLLRGMSLAITSAINQLDNARILDSPTSTFFLEKKKILLSPCPDLVMTGARLPATIHFLVRAADEY